MNPTETNTSFEDRLLTELRTVVAERSRPRRRKRRAFVAVAACLTLAAGTAIALPLIGGEQTTPPAYSVTVERAGTVTVKVVRFEDAEGLERDLAAVGVAADVNYLPVGKTCKRTPAGALVMSDAKPDKNGLVKLEPFAAWEEHDGYAMLVVYLSEVKNATLTIESTALPPLGPDGTLRSGLLKNGTFGPCVPVDA